MTVETTLTACLQAALPGVPVIPDGAQSTVVAPYVVYTQFAGTRVNSLQGDSSLANPRFQIDLYATTKAECVAKKSLIRAAILGAVALGAVFVSDGSAYEADTKLYRHRQDFSFWFYD